MQLGPEVSGRENRSELGERMKKIVAVLQPSKFDAAKDALIEIGVYGMTASEARGYGRQKGHKEVFRGREYSVDLLPKIKLEIVIPDSRVEEVVHALAKAARTGRIGDGKIFVFDIEEAIRIRNEERGEAAL
jgi:nitrogen regulatory protein P-II 1